MTNTTGMSHLKVRALVFFARAETNLL